MAGEHESGDLGPLRLVFPFLSQPLVASNGVLSSARVPDILPWWTRGDRKHDRGLSLGGSEPMKLRASFILILLFCSTMIFSQQAAVQDSGHSRSVSLIRLIANPDDFNGQSVEVVGFLARDGGLDRAVGLFVSDVDARNFVISNSVDLSVDESKVKDRMGWYVVLSGTYHSPDPRARYNGYIDHILGVEALNSGNKSK